MFREICTFNPFSFYSLSLWVQLPTLLFDDDVFLSFFGTCLWLWTQSPVFLVLRDYPMRLCSAAPTVPPTSELMGNVSPLLNTPTEQEKKKKKKKNLWHHTLLDRMTPDSAPNLLRLFFTQLQSSLCNKCVLFRPPIMPQKRIIINIVFFFLSSVWMTKKWIISLYIFIKLKKKIVHQL